MSGNRDVIYWDSCVFYAFLKAEEHRKGELNSIKQAQREFDIGKIVLVTSTITLAEVLPSKLTDEQKQLFESISRRSNFSWVDVSLPVANLAVNLRSNYTESREDKEFRLSTPDAIHIASAIAHKSTRLVTFDEKNKRKERELGILRIAKNIEEDYSLIVSRPEISVQKEFYLDATNVKSACNL